MVLKGQGADYSKGGTTEEESLSSSPSCHSPSQTEQHSCLRLLVARVALTCPFLLWGPSNRVDLAFQCGDCHDDKKVLGREIEKMVVVTHPPLEL